MHQALSPKPGSETPESQKVPFLLVKRIREAILDETFQPGDRLVEADLAEEFESQPPAGPRSAPRPGKRRHGHYEPVQRGDGETPVGGRSHGYRGTQVGTHLSSPKTGVPSSFPAVAQS
jgi:hypothetical protein